MINTQNLRAIIINLIEQENKLKMVYEEAKEQSSRAYKRMFVWKKAYIASNDDEEVAQIFDDVYDEYSETEVQVEAIDEALEELHNSIKAIGRLSL